MNKLKETYSLATLPISKAAYTEIKQKLLAVKYYHVIHESGISGELLDMNGIALIVEPEESEPEVCVLCNKPCKPNREGQFICYQCATKTIEDIVNPKEELSRKDRNYYLSKENK